MMSINKPFVYEIRIEGLLSERWADWFEGLVIQNESSGESVFIGLIVDQAALLGILTKIHSLNLTLISVNRQSLQIKY